MEAAPAPASQSDQTTQPAPTTPPATTTTTPSPGTEPPKPLIGGEEPKPEVPKFAQDFEPVTFDKLKLPEGFEVDHELSKEFNSIVNDKTLSRPELVQRLIDLQAKSVSEASERGSKSFTDMTNDWRETWKKDPEIGGDKFDKVLAEANRVVKQYGSPGLAQALATTGMSDHPEFARFLSKIAPFITEPPPVGGDPITVNDTKPSVNNLYPEMKPTGA